MATIEQLEISLRQQGQATGQAGHLEVIHFSGKDRALNTVKWCGLFLGLAVFSAFIPVLHFVLVPLFSFGAAGALILIPFSRESLHAAVGACPYCGQTTKLARATLKRPFTDLCEHCHQLIEIS